MDRHFQDVLNHSEANHLLPFLWMHDGHHDELPALVKQIYDSGARALCVESRPHEGFCGPTWWDDMDVVLAEAQKLGMKVWILDDKHFPTGYANGLVMQKYPERRKWQLIEEHADVVNPAPGSALMVSDSPDDVLVGVYAYPLSEDTEDLINEHVCLTDSVKDGYVTLDLPAGVWRIMMLYKSRRGTREPDYIHLIDPDSVDVLIEAVYEPHYQHYASLFGSTLAGFFSDEPSFGNKQTVGGRGSAVIYDQKLGQPGLALPWTDELLRELDAAMGGDCKPYLAALWYDMPGVSSNVRLKYMDIVTTLWRRHFSYRLGDWCRAHGVEYIGHIIEDQNCHARLAYSGGHYFRSLDGQDMAGIDVVLHQIMPGLAHYQYSMSCATGVSDGEFFHYVLGRLAASHSRIQPRMKGRAMCEIFGAYGWAEGVPMMKWLMDHMLVRGVNQFVPHAFSPKYPDPDCPPHFGAGGCNPEFDAFSQLMRYTNQTAHLLEGHEVVSCAVLYHAEAEWSGQECMLTQKPARLLMDSQLNYHILPIDSMLTDAAADGTGFNVNGTHYAALVIPGAKCLPQAFCRKVEELAAQGVKIAFVDYKPEECNADVIALSDVPAFVRSCGGTDISLSQRFPLLRYYHVQRDGADVFLLVNESLQADFDGEVTLPVSGNGALLRLASGEMYRINAANGKLHLNLPMYGSAILVFDGDDHADLPQEPVLTATQPVQAKWTLTLTSAHDKPCDITPHQLDALYDVTGPTGDSGFAGWMRYEATVTAPQGAWLDLGLVGECAGVTLNGIDCGTRMAPPYVFDTSKAIHEGENKLVVEVTNNLVRHHRDFFSRYVLIQPSGMLGPVTWRTEN